MPRSRTALVSLALVSFGLASADARADAGEPGGLSTAKPLSPEMRAIEVDEQRSIRVDGSARFRDHLGSEVALASLFDDRRPILLTLNYYRCRVVCSVQLTKLAEALAELDWTPGDENFRVVTVSIDPNETPADAANRREVVLAQLGRGQDVDWQFLTGDAVAISALAAQLGIGYAYDPEQDQYAHPAVAVFLMPDGKIAQYLYGLALEPRDIKLALLEAGEGKIGTPMEKLYQSCFSYDSTIGRYGPTAMGIMRISGVATVALLSTFLVFLWRRERRRRKLGDPSLHSRAEALS